MTVEAVCERLNRRQFEEGEDIFAVQWSDIHKMAQTGDIRGLRCEKRKGDPAIDFATCLFVSPVR